MEAGKDWGEMLDAQFVEHVAVAAETKAQTRAEFSRLVAACCTALRGGCKVLFFGNGGSAADAQHLATEFTVRFRKNRPALAALALTTDTSTLTAIGNDLGFDQLFARQVEAIAKPGDVAIGITTSGNSPNVLEALRQAKAMRCTVVTFTGGDGGKAVSLADIALLVPSRSTARIQEMHILIGHSLCEAVERDFGYA